MQLTINGFDLGLEISTVIVSNNSEIKYDWLLTFSFRLQFSSSSFSVSFRLRAFLISPDSSVVAFKLLIINPHIFGPLSAERKDQTLIYVKGHVPKLNLAIVQVFKLTQPLCGYMKVTLPLCRYIQTNLALLESKQHCLPTCRRYTTDENTENYITEPRLVYIKF